MNCPICDQKARVIDSRSEGGVVTRRSYRCECEVGFATLEVIQDDTVFKGDRRKLALGFNADPEAFRPGDRPRGERGKFLKRRAAS